MSFKFLCFILASWLLSFACNALDLPKSPFWGNKADFTIELTGDKTSTHKTLSTLLEEELVQQRKNNRRLQQYSKRSKIARYESQLLNERLRAEGYYAGEIRSNLQNDRIVYWINPGPLYHIKQFVLELPSAIAQPASNALGIREGDPLRSQAVLNAKKALTDYIALNFCFYRIDVDYRVIVFHTTHSAQVILHVEDSQTVTLGNIAFTGLQSLDESYLQERLPIKQGDCFKRNRIDTAHLSLMQSNLLARADFHIGEPINGSVPISIDVVERLHRTVSTGAGFQSDEGFGLSAGWEHRNFMGRAQKVSVDAYLAQNLQTVSSSLTVPHFRRNHQSITFYTELEHEDTDAFESKLATVGIEVSRALEHHLRGTIGTELEFSEVKEDLQTDTFALFSVPLTLEYDKRNDPLDPRHGWVASGQVRPYWDTYDTNTQFIKSTLAASAYLSFENWTWQPTFAIRGALGTISGIERDQVPATVRYYVGGGGSVRGYPFQSLGPLTDNDPDGGLSFNEVSLETRLRWGNHWGGVVFLDGGYAYEDAWPELGQNLRWGAGFGVRYYTSFAPIRFDIGVPLNKRDEVDDDFQLYISIGQAF
ncbi:MAG: autotransporter assembly complex family protein [Porticoccus sp.]|nr:autotransporter assembly complex family protein [Porticoccus sp.]